MNIKRIKEILDGMVNRSHAHGTEPMNTADIIEILKAIVEESPKP